MAADWRMGLAVLWVVPISFLLAAGTRPMVDQVERRQKGKKIAASDGIQECIENIQDIRANNQQEEYLRGLDQKILNVESITIRLELLNGTMVTASQMFLKVGMATTVLAGAALLSSHSIGFMMFLMFMVASTRLYGPLTGCLQNLSAVYSALLVVERMKGIEEQPVQQGSREAAYDGYDIVFDHVGFSYKEGKQVLKDVSFTARQGHEWQQPEGSTGKEKYSTEIKIFANNRIGMFVDISKVFTERQIDITSMNVRTSKQGKATIMMAFDIHGIEELNKLTDKLRQIEGVLDIERTAG